ncbi:MAG: hypothetical protein DMG12_25455 [Acidobacteria bacterium]|nr:MAG: hypothetical protein DMG12_25455 [Acidobacteriota bacterium]
MQICKVKWHCRGKACLIRYADDFVCAFENQDEAQRFYGAPEFRLEKFGLQLAAAKSRVLPFSRDGEPGSARFDFSGFEFTWGKDRAGKPHLRRRTSRKKLRNSLANFTQWCKQSRHLPLRDLFPTLKLKFRGYGVRLLVRAEDRERAIEVLQSSEELNQDGLEEPQDDL